MPETITVLNFNIDNCTKTGEAKTGCLTAGLFIIAKLTNKYDGRLHFSGDSKQSPNELLALSDLHTASNRCG